MFITPFTQICFSPKDHNNSAHNKYFLPSKYLFSLFSIAYIGSPLTPTSMVLHVADQILSSTARRKSNVEVFQRRSRLLFFSSQRLFGKGFQLAVSYDSSSGCGPSRAAAGWPR